MIRLQVIFSTLESIEKNSNKLLKKTIPLLKSLKDVNSDEFLDIQDEYELVPTQDLIEITQQCALKIISDYERIKKELDIFVNDLLDKGADDDDRFKECPFFGEIWYGDAYDGLSGTNALFELDKDLSKQVKRINLSKIIKDVGVVVEKRG